MAEGVDYSTARPDVGLLWQSGKQFACRYFGLGSRNKLATVTELAALHAMGLSTVALAEQWGNSALQGHALGTSHAQTVLQDLADKDVPPDRPAYFAVDFDVTAQQWNAVRDYFNGIHKVIPLARIGIYGGYRAVSWAHRDQIASWFFQTYAWSSGEWFPGNHLEQWSNDRKIGGADVDYTRSKTADFGQWGGAPLPPGVTQPGTVPVTGPQPWDYAGEIEAHASNEGILATTLAGYTRDLEQLRNN